MKKIWKALPPSVRKAVKWAVPIAGGLIVIALSKTAVGAWFEDKVFKLSEKISPGAGGTASGGDPENPPEV